MHNILVYFLGFYATLIHGDAGVVSRYFWLKKHLTRGKVRTLDAGCGTGAFSFLAARLGNEVLGLSFDKRNGDIATERAVLLKLPNAKFQVGDLRELSTLALALGLFDQIICCETIEHIKDDEKLVRDMAALLNTGGKLLLTTPYLYYRHLPGDNISEVENGGHMRWGDTHEGLRGKFRVAGLSTIVEEYVVGIIAQYLIRFERLLSMIMPGKLAWLISFPFRIMHIFDPLLMKIIRYPYLSVAMVAVKTTRTEEKEASINVTTGQKLI